MEKNRCLLFPQAQWVKIQGCDLYGAKFAFSAQYNIKFYLMLSSTENIHKIRKEFQLFLKICCTKFLKKGKNIFCRHHHKIVQRSKKCKIYLSVSVFYLLQNAQHYRSVFLVRCGQNIQIRNEIGVKLNYRYHSLHRFVFQI